MSEMKKGVKLLFYCTKAKPLLYRCLDDRWRTSDNCDGWVFAKNSLNFNGKVVAEAECDLVEEIKIIPDILFSPYHDFCTNTLTENELLKKSCLMWSDLFYYIEDKGYAIYPKNVKPFGTPKELSEFYQPQNSCMNSFGWIVDSMQSIKKAPQNMMIVYDNDGNLYVLISIKSKHLFKILNGEKTIEVRKSILNALKELIPNA